MSVGNLNTEGDKKNNFTWQNSVLQLLGAITPPPGGLATEATLLQVLAALQNGQEYEQNLVIDTGDPACAGGNCPTYLEVRIWDTVTHTFGPPRFFNAAGVEFFLGGNPLYGPMELVNPQFVLTSMLTELVAINSNTTGINKEATQLLIKALLTTIDADTSNLDVPLSTRASQATLASVLAQLDVALSTRASEVTLLTRATEVTLLTRATEATALLMLARLVSLDGKDFATQTTLAALNAKFNSLGQKTMLNSAPVVLASDQSAINVTLPSGLQTITSIVAVANGTVAAGAASVSALFSANFSGSFNGAARAKGTFLTLSANEGKTLAAIPYTVTGGSITIDVII